MVIFEELTFYDGNAVSSLALSRSMTHALLFNRSCARLSANQPSTATAWRRNTRGSAVGSAVTADPPAFAENDGPESQIDPGLGDLGGLRQAMLPRRFGLCPS